LHFRHTEQALRREYDATDRQFDALPICSLQRRSRHWKYSVFIVKCLANVFTLHLSRCRAPHPFARFDSRTIAHSARPLDCSGSVGVRARPARPTSLDTRLSATPVRWFCVRLSGYCHVVEKWLLSYFHPTFKVTSLSKATLQMCVHSSSAVSSFVPNTSMSVAKTAYSFDY